MSLISAIDVDVSHGRNRVLTGVNFSIDTGEIVTIVGPNGSGKTSFARVLIGAMAPSAGRVLRKAGLRIGYVPQKLGDTSLMPMTALRFLKLSGQSDPAKIRPVMEQLDIEDLALRQIDGLSGGEMQRVLLAQALLCDPDILVLDEPTQGLDQPATAAFYRLIEKVRGSVHCAVLMISHDLHVVMSASDRVICLNGHICCEGTPTVVSAAPEYRALFGEGTGGALALYRHHHDHRHDQHHHHDRDAHPQPHVSADHDRAG